MLELKTRSPESHLYQVKPWVNMTWPRSRKYRAWPNENEKDIEDTFNIDILGCRRYTAFDRKTEVETSCDTTRIKRRGYHVLNLYSLAI